MFEDPDESFGETDWLADPLEQSRKDGEKKIKAEEKKFKAEEKKFTVVNDSEVPVIGSEVEVVNESADLMEDVGAWALEAFNAAYTQDSKVDVAEWVDRHAPET